MTADAPRGHFERAKRGQNALPPVPYDQHEREVLQLVQERDRLEAIADRLAEAIAPPEVLGEHSSANDPWQNALDYAESRAVRTGWITHEPHGIKGLLCDPTPSEAGR